MSNVSNKYAGLWMVAIAMMPLGMGVIRAAEVPLVNPSFDSPAIEAEDSERNPAGWGVFASGKEGVGINSKIAKSGKQSARIMVPPSYKPDGNQGLNQKVKVVPGKTYKFTIYAKMDTADMIKGSVRGQISIEWQDANKKELDRTWGPDWGAALSADEWQKFEVTGQAPAGATVANLVITEFFGPGEDTAGTFYVDDASLAEQ